MFIKTGALVGVALATSVVGCSSDDGEAFVSPTVEVVDTATSALGSSAVQWINGSYNTCLTRTGSWSARVSGTNPMDNAALTVVKDDTACVLKITSVMADQAYNPAAPMTLGTAYSGSATFFSPASGGAVQFSANAKLSAVDFGADFLLTFLYSGDVTSTDAPDITGTYAQVTGSTAVLTVTAPNYTISLTSGTPLTIQLNASKVVQSVAGNITLTDGSILGTNYVIDNGNTTSTFLAAGIAYGLGTERTLSGSNPTIPASQLALVGVDLTSTVYRTIIVSRTVGIVKGYQLFKIAFKAP